MFHSGKKFFFLVLMEINIWEDVDMCKVNTEIGVRKIDFDTGRWVVTTTEFQITSIMVCKRNIYIR